MMSSVCRVASTLRVAGARMVGMAMRDQRAIDRPHRIDEEIAGRAVEALGPWVKQVACAHAAKIVVCGRVGRLLQ